MEAGAAMDIDRLRAEVAEFLSTTFAPPAGLEDAQFSAFSRAQVQEASLLARQLSAIAKERGVAGVLEFARAQVTQRLPSIVKYALLIFLTHDPIGSQVGPPSLEERHPTAVAAMVATTAARTAADPTSLSFFREDVYANDHHAHWHLVYNTDPGTEERHGELFLYMHQQMLARYDAERLGVGRPPVEPLGLEAPATIDEGYDSHQDAYTPRPDNTPLDPTAAADLLGRQQAFEQTSKDGSFDDAVERGAFDPRFNPNVPQPALNLLGATIEAVAASASFQGTNMHNNGHIYIASVPDPHKRGVMRDTSVAIRDPVFWRWHKLIDDQGAAWQDVQPPRDFTSDDDRPPPVKMSHGADGESPALILCRRGALDLHDFSDETEGAAFGAQAFGGAHWNESFANAAPGTDTLQTHMATRPGPQGTRIQYLDMVDEFAYFIRVENPGQNAVAVTARIFLVPDEASGDRRRWIEMDKFLATIAPGQNVLYRPSSLSSVVRKPVARPPGPASPEQGHVPSAYCQCGWPYNLLLPRGTRDGMRCRLLVMLTDASWDKGVEESCGSMSFCGVRDTRYPDRRNMGYPFDRPLRNGLVASLGALDTVAMRTFTIQLVD
jgi:tyrosinase